MNRVCHLDLRINELQTASKSKGRAEKQVCASVRERERKTKERERRFFLVFCKVCEQRKEENEGAASN